MLFPLIEKLKLKIFSWSADDSKIVLEIENEIMKNQKLSLPNFDEDFTLVCDASNHGISGILSQKEKLIRLFSRKLSDRERLLSVCDKERLAISKSLEKCKALIGNNKVFILSDNKNLTFINKDSPRTRTFKYFLSQFKFEISHIPNKENLAADYLSRFCKISSKESQHEMKYITKWKMRLADTDTSGKLIIPEEHIKNSCRIFTWKMDTQAHARVCQL